MILDFPVLIWSAISLICEKCQMLLMDVDTKCINNTSLMCSKFLKIMWFPLHANLSLVRTEWCAPLWFSSCCCNKVKKMTNFCEMFWTYFFYYFLLRWRVIWFCCCDYHSVCVGFEHSCCGGTDFVWSSQEQTKSTEDLSSIYKWYELHILNTLFIKYWKTQNLFYIIAKC